MNDKDYVVCPSHHFLTKKDRIKKMGSSYWKYTPDIFLGIKAKRVYDEGYFVEKFIGGVPHGGL